jgi:phosphopantothenoylcysteine decarboxylase/phosphopantothenate--cysteine ligase
MNDRNILLAVTGGIAVYKALELTRLFTKAGAAVRIVMTRHATAFVTPLSFETLSGNTVGVDLMSLTREREIGHIEYARWADVAVVAPATANLLGKLAGGIADDLLTTALMALPGEAPLVIAPAMNTRMWENPAVQRNLGILRDLYGRRLHQVGPVSKELACKEEGLGAMAEVQDIFEVVRGILG